VRSGIGMAGRDSGLIYFRFGLCEEVEFSERHFRVFYLGQGLFCNTRYHGKCSAHVMGVEKRTRRKDY
jgi:hypothetical protein